MKRFGLILAILVILLAALYVTFRPTLERLSRVNSLFEAEHIVENFSNMDDVLYSKSLPRSGPVYEWPIFERPLPVEVLIDGEPRLTEEFLAETQTTALLVIQDGTIIHEQYYLGTDASDQRISWSVAKSFLSALFGIVVEAGQIQSLSDPVTKYVPQLAGSAYDGIKIEDVLHMSSGVKFNEDYLDSKSDINRMGRVLALGQSMDAFAAGLKERAYPAGERRQYVSIDTHVLAMVLRNATGKTLHELFVENFWSKLGPGKDAYYLTDGDGVAFALGGLNMRTRDYALFGQLFLQNGMWEGEKLVPETWVRLSTLNSAPSDAETDNSGVGYGYQWWVPLDSKDHGNDYFAVGIYEQYIYVNPKTRTVIVKNSANRNFKALGKSGKSYKLESIDMFRALSEHFESEILLKTKGLQTDELQDVETSTEP